MPEIPELFDIEFIFVLVALLMAGAIVKWRRNRSPVDRILTKKERDKTRFFRSLRKEEQRIHMRRHEYFPG